MTKSFYRQSILFVLFWVCMCTAICAAGFPESSIRVYPALDRKALFLELDSLPHVDAGIKRYSIEVTLSQSVAQTGHLKKAAVASKCFHVDFKKSQQMQTLKLAIPKQLFEWTPQNPMSYQLQIVVKGKTGEYDLNILQSTMPVSFPDKYDLPAEIRGVYEDSRYAGYDGEVPIGEIDFRTRLYRNSGYILLRDKERSSHPRFIRNCASLGMLCEPLMAPYSANTSSEQELYLKQVERWVKERACSAAVFHWLLPEMPDSVETLCRQRIATIDSRPVLKYNDQQLLPVEEPRPEPSLQEPKLLEDTIRKVAEVSILHAVPGIEYLYRVNCGGDEVTDSNGNVWAADTMTTNQKGHTDASIRVSVAEELQLLAEADQPVLQSYRICNTADSMSYRFPVDSMGSYCVEVFMQEPILQKMAGRTFRIMVNDALTDYFDLRAAASGSNVVIKFAFSIITGNKDYIEIKFPKAYSGHPIVSGIAIGSNIVTH